MGGRNATDGSLAVWEGRKKRSKEKREKREEEETVGLKKCNRWY